jgi:hypothetical protein
MGSWYYGYGLEGVLPDSFVNPVFHGIWGVCDEDLIVRTIVIADHNVRVRTGPNGVMPLDNYRIYGLILGGGVIKSQVYKKTCTQADVMATTVDLFGVDLVHPIIGRTFFSPAKEGFALMRFYSLYKGVAMNRLTH